MLVNIHLFELQNNQNLTHSAHPLEIQLFKRFQLQGGASPLTP